MIHGWGGSFEGTWGKTGWADALRKAGREVIGIDVRGHGRTPASHDPADYGDLASDVDAMLPDGPLDAIGFSLGGKLSLELASRKPNRFRRIVLGGLGDNIFAKEAGSGLADALERGFPEEDRARMPVMAAYVDESPSDYRAIAAAIRRPHNPQAEVERLKAIQSEILLINGDKDSVADPDARLRAALPRHQYLSLPGVDHFTMHHQASFRDAAIAFLNG
jgi:pimeloyl-ACP methyl ester carboxylesterase